MSKDIETILGDDINFRGKLEFTRGLQINGKFKGQILTKGFLLLGSTAEMDGDIKAADVTIKGKLKGTIIAEKKVSLMQNGQIKGDIRTPDLQIESGSQFSGNCSMD